ncbi:ATP-binding protein [Amedibacillus sp. YH-ame6]
MGRDYKLKVSPRMLELLSKDLYTNMYFVLAELIANAYDADAENVYVFISDDEIRVEDDGLGMSSDILDNHYLLIGSESRNSEENSRTQGKKRLKMGRKGVGKLAALSISTGFKLITVQNSISIGIFIPHRVEHDDEVLRILEPNEFELRKISRHGTAVIMDKPKVRIPKLQTTVMKNLAKIFPNDISDFKIHIIYKGEHEILVPDEKEVISRLATFISIGNEKKYLENSLPKASEKHLQIKHLDAIAKNLKMKNSKSKEENLELRIYGWIGTFKTSRGMKKEINEFSDNYLAIFAHNKMGVRNILSAVGKNRVYESYIVGNLYIDAFEASGFPDMAGTNRQGYNENDLRWEVALEYIRTLTDEIVRLHGVFAKLEQKEKNKFKEEKKALEEEKLKDKLNFATKNMADNLTKKFNQPQSDFSIKQAVETEILAMNSLLGFKSIVDANKKKIMISQTLNDKPISDIIYKMLLFNNVPKEDIIYSNGPDPETNLPETNIYEYLQKFFVNSASTEMIYVLFVTSKNVLNIEPDNPSASWGELMEIGAAWVTQKDHWIFNINDFELQQPLNIRDKWVALYTKEDEGENIIISLTEAMANSFCNKIMETCRCCGYRSKSFEQNKEYLINNYVSIYMRTIA